MLRLGLCFACLAAPIWAQEDFMSHYNNEVTGFYAPEGVCMGAELIVNPHKQTFNIGETTCMLARVQPEGDWLRVDAVACRAEGDAADDRSYLIRLDEDGALILRREGLEDVTLPRCAGL